jgi:tetratricopeptide (TPR) repeat protein
MAKPMLVTLPATLLLLDVWPLDRQATPWSRRLLEKAPLFALAIASSVITVLVQHAAIASLELVPWPIRLANAVLSFGRYLLTLIWPTNLSILYQLTDSAPLDRLALAIIAIVLISWVAWRTKRAWPFILVGWLWYLGTLLPVIGLVQVGMQAMADRYTYIPSVGIFIAVVWAGWALAARARIAPLIAGGVATAIVAILAVVAHAQAATWATNETLWHQAVTATSNNPRAHIELGVVYGHQNRHAEAESEFMQALQMKLGPNDAKDLFPNLAGSLIAQGKLAAAIPQLEQALELDPSRVDLRHQLALAYGRVGRTDDAIKSWRDALRINPQFEDAYLGLGILLASQGKNDEARQALTELLRINPNRKDAQQALARIGK